MGRTLLLRVRKLASSSGNFLAWIGDCSGGLESKGCLSDLGLGGVCVVVFSLGVPHIYGAFVCSLFSGLCSSCTEIRFLYIYIIFAVQKKKLITTKKEGDNFFLVIFFFS